MKTKENDSECISIESKENINKISQESIKKIRNLNNHFNCTFYLNLGESEYKLSNKIKIFGPPSRNEKIYMKTTTNLPSLTIEPKDFYYKNCFTKPNIYYTTKSLYKVKIETSDSLNHLSRNISNDVKTILNEKWKIKVKGLSKTNSNHDDLFITSNKALDQEKIYPQRFSSINKLRKINSINELKGNFLRGKNNSNAIMTNYNKKVLETNNKKNFVFYNSLKKALHLPSLVYDNKDKFKNNSEKSSYNSNHIRLSESCRIRLVKKVLVIDTL